MLAHRYTFSTLISLYSASSRHVQPPPPIPFRRRHTDVPTGPCASADKWMFSPEHYGFGFPLFVTACHMLVQFVLCSLVLTIFPSLRPAHRPEPRGYAWVPFHDFWSVSLVADSSTHRPASTKVVPCGLATGLDIGLSNLSLKTITLSFYSERSSYLIHSAS